MSDDGAILFWVPGIPQTKGSTKGFIGRSKTTGKPRAFITNDNPKNKQWAQDVVRIAQRYASSGPMDGPVSLALSFFLVRARKPKHPEWPITKPDLDKITRSILDSLKQAGIYHDDAQVCAMHCLKFFAHHGPGVEILVRPLIHVAR